MEYLKVKNWERYQHYKKRDPPWIKLHKSLLLDYDFICLQDASKLHLILIWLLASHTNGLIPNDSSYISASIDARTPVDLKLLIEKGFLLVQNASTTRKAMPAKTETETETEKDIAIAYAFDAFWSAYPRKTAKQAALKAWKKLNPLNGDFEKIMKGLEAAKSCRQWKEENGRFIPFPATWLNGRRFEDEVQAPVKETFPI